MQEQARLTRERLHGDPPSAAEVEQLREFVADKLAKVKVPEWDRAAGTSKAFRSLARLTGAEPSEAGPGVPTGAPCALSCSACVSNVPRVASAATARWRSRSDSVCPSRV